MKILKYLDFTLPWFACASSSYVGESATSCTSELQGQPVIFDYSRFSSIDSIIFEFCIKRSITGTEYVKLYNVTAAEDVTGSEIATVTASQYDYLPVRTVDLKSYFAGKVGPQTLIIMRKGSSASSWSGSGGHLIVSQTAVNGLMGKTETEIPIGAYASQNLTNNYADVMYSWPFTFDSSKFSAFTKAYLKVGLGENYNTSKTFQLYDVTAVAAVTGSEFTINNAAKSNGYFPVAESGVFNLINGHQYKVQVHTLSTTSCYNPPIFLVIKQSGSITATQTHIMNHSGYQYWQYNDFRYEQNMMFLDGSEYINKTHAWNYYSLLSSNGGITRGKLLNQTAGADLTTESSDTFTSVIKQSTIKSFTIPATQAKIQSGFANNNDGVYDNLFSGWLIGDFTFDPYVPPIFFAPNKSAVSGFHCFIEQAINNLRGGYSVAKEPSDNEKF